MSHKTGKNLGFLHDFFFVYFSFRKEVYFLLTKMFQNLLNNFFHDRYISEQYWKSLWHHPRVPWELTLQCYMGCTGLVTQGVCISGIHAGSSLVHYSIGNVKPCWTFTGFIVPLTVFLFLVQSRFVACLFYWFLVYLLFQVSSPY